MYLVSVYFDDKSNKIISDYINKIAQKTGNTFMTDNHVPPSSDDNVSRGKGGR